MYERLCSFFPHHLGVRLGIDDLEELDDVISVHRLPILLFILLHNISRWWGRAEALRAQTWNGKKLRKAKSAKLRNDGNGQQQYYTFRIV